MSVFIKGIDLPEVYGPATLTVYECKDGHGIPKEYKLSAMQMQAIPPHGRLGDLDKLEQMLVDIDNAPYSGFDGTEPFYSAEDAALIIRLAPTIIEAEEDE